MDFDFVPSTDDPALMVHPQISLPKSQKHMVNNAKKQKWLAKPPSNVGPTRQRIVVLNKAKKLLEKLKKEGLEEGIKWELLWQLSVLELPSWARRKLKHMKKGPSSKVPEFAENFLGLLVEKCSKLAESAGPKR